MVNENMTEPLENPKDSNPEDLEKAKKMFEMYKKSILNKDFDIANTLDISQIDPEELDKFKINAFNKFLTEKVEYFKNHFVNIHNLQIELNNIRDGLALDNQEIINEKINKFIKQVVIENLYNFTNSTYKHPFLDKFKQWKEESNISDSEWKDIIKKTYLRKQTDWSEEIQKRYTDQYHTTSYDGLNRKRLPEKEIDEKVLSYKQSLPELNKESFSELLNNMGIEYSLEELVSLKEEGAIEFLEKMGYQSFADPLQIKLAFDIAGLDSSSFLNPVKDKQEEGFNSLSLAFKSAEKNKELYHPENVENLVASKFLKNINQLNFEKNATSYRPYDYSNNNDIYQRLRYLSQSPLFPSTLEDYPDIQNSTDAGFKKALEQLGLKENEFTPSEYLISEFKNNSSIESVSPTYSYRYVERLTTLAESMVISKDVLNSKQFVSLVSKYVEDYFSDEENPSHFSIDKNLLSKLDFKLDILKSRAQNLFFDILETNQTKKISKLIDLKKEFDLSDDFIHSEDLIKSEISFFEDLINQEDLRKIATFLDLVDFPQDVIDSDSFVSFKERIIKIALSNGLSCAGVLSQIAKDLNLRDHPKSLEDEELKEKVENILNKNIGINIRDFAGTSYNDFTHDSFKFIHGRLSFTKTDKYDYKYREGFSSKVNNFISSYNYILDIGGSELLKDYFNKCLSENFSNTENLSDSYALSEFSKVSKNFDLDPEEIKKIRLNLLKKSIGVAVFEKEHYRHTFLPNSESIDEYAEKFGLSNDEMRELALSAFTHLMSSEQNNPDKEAKKIFDRFNFTQDEVKESAESLYVKYVAKGWNERALQIKKDYNLSVDSSDMSNEIEKAFLSRLEKRDLYNIEKQISILSSDFLSGSEIQQLGKKIFSDLLLKGQEKEARKIKDLLQLDIKDIYEIIGGNVPALKFFSQLEYKFPRLAQKYLNSIDAFISIYSQIDERIFLTLDAHPFLAGALEENEKFGIKLLLKYPSLDKLSKANIGALYQNKASILENRSDIDVDSRDFRIEMQDKLESYRRNQDIVASLRKSGINVEEWLNYNNEMYFELGNEGDVSLSEIVSTPIERIHENMSQYTEVTKEVLTEYKAEFLAFEVPLKDIEELRENVRGLRAQLEGIKHEGDEIKIEGIKKAIINMESQIENPKTIPLWNKILNTLSLVNILNKDIFKAYTLLVESESGLKEKEADTSIPSTLKRKEVLRLKHKIEKSKKDIDEKVKLFFTRLIKFDNDFINMVSLAIGKERAEGLDQERRGVINELFDHFTSDGDTLNNIFSQKENDNLDGRPMKISVWNRDPDIDLYLGNYTNCCIRIDSDHMGEESTIADYLTDLGMQIVNIYDEKENIPIASAWCFIGHNDDDKVSLVIDNIEANSDYSSKHKAQLQQKLLEYITKYTRDISTSKSLDFVQGQSNNDLVVSRMDSDYFKVGGYNRASGYYLEGEGK